MGSAVKMRTDYSAAVRQPVVAQELPDVLDRVEFRRAGREQDDGDVVGHMELGRAVPADLIHKQNGMGPLRDGA